MDFFCKPRKFNAEKSSPERNEFISELAYREAMKSGWAREGAKRRCYVAVSHLSSALFSSIFSFCGKWTQWCLTRVTFFPKAKAAITHVKKRATFLPWGVCSSLGRVTGKRESWAEPEEQSDKLQRGARMTEQHRVSQLVHNKRWTVRLLQHLGPPCLWNQASKQPLLHLISFSRQR